MTPISQYQSECESDDEDETLEELVIQPEPPSQGRLQQDISQWYTTQFEVYYEIFQL